MRVYTKALLLVYNLLVRDFFYLDLPPRSETFDRNTGLRTVTEYIMNDDNKKVKVVKTYKVETIKVSKAIARRKV